MIDQFEELFTADAAAPDGAVARKEAVTLEDGSPRQAAFLRVLEAIAGQDARAGADPGGGDAAGRLHGAGAGDRPCWRGFCATRT